VNLLTAPETLPFGVALGVLVGLAIIEGIGAFTSVSPSQLLDSLLPHPPSAEAPDHPDASGGVLGWLHLGKVPLLVILILFLMGFSLGGYVLQLFSHSLFGRFVSPLWICPPALFIGLTTARSLGALVAHIIPRDESSAVSELALIGRAGVVMGGVARQGMAAQVRVRDLHGRTHYLMVEPDAPDEEFREGTPVLIVKKSGAIYRGILNPHPDLL
jgi:hypothetical protein